MTTTTTRRTDPICGIGSITLTGKASSEWDLEKGADALLAELMSRGRDASGLMGVNLKGEVFYEKAAVDAREFIAARGSLPGNVRAIGVHTRMATKGAKGWNRNNHPVLAGEALVMHNGVVDDDEIERVVGNPEVDTYALAVAAWRERERLAGESNKAQAERITLGMAQVDGSAACIVALIGQPVLLSMKLNGSPLYYASANGVRICASTRTAIEKCADAMDLQLPGVTETITRKEKGEDVTTTRTVEKIELAETGRVLSWHAGSHSMQKIEVPERVLPKSWSSANYGRYGTAGRIVDGKWTRWDDDDEYSLGHGHAGYSVGSAALRPVTQITAADGYPEGTPQPGSDAGDALARRFKFWRQSQHGMKWARENTTSAAAYDAVAGRRLQDNKTPPFPTKSELVAMEADPLFTSGEATPTGLLTPPARAESNGLGGAGIDDYSVAEIEQLTDEEWEEWLASGEITTRRDARASETYEAIATRMLADPGIALTDVPGEPDHGVVFDDDPERCDLCDELFLEGEPRIITDDGVACDDCYRIYQFEGVWS